MTYDYSELYPDHYASITVDRDGNEWFGDVRPNPAPITYRASVAAEPINPPDVRPAITAWDGADMDAYHYADGRWLHCQTGIEWSAFDIAWARQKKADIRLELTLAGMVAL